MSSPPRPRVVLQSREHRTAESLTSPVPGQQYLADGADTAGSKSRSISRRAKGDLLGRSVPERADRNGVAVSEALETMWHDMMQLREELEEHGISPGKQPQQHQQQQQLFGASMAIPSRRSLCLQGLFSDASLPRRPPAPLNKLLSGCGSSRLPPGALSPHLGQMPGHLSEAQVQASAKGKVLRACSPAVSPSPQWRMRSCQPLQPQPVWSFHNTWSSSPAMPPPSTRSPPRLRLGTSDAATFSEGPPPQCPLSVRVSAREVLEKQFVIEDPSAFSVCPSPSVSRGMIRGTHLLPTKYVHPRCT